MEVFRMIGNKVQVNHYQVDYTTYRRNEEGKPVEAAVSRGFPTFEEAEAVKNQHNGTMKELDAAPYLWLDGLEFSSFEEARKAMEMGEEAYRKAQAEKEAAKPESQITDLQLAMVESYESTAQQITDIQLALAELYERGSV